MEFKKRELNLKIYDNEYTLEIPKAKRVNQYQKDCVAIIKGEKELDEYELASELLIDCGMTKELVDELYYDDMLEVVKALTMPKKN